LVKALVKSRFSFHDSILPTFPFLLPITPVLHHSILHNFNTSHIKVMIAVATMIEIMPVTTAEVAA